MPPPDDSAIRREKIIEGLRGRTLDQAVNDPDLMKAMKEESESADPDRLVTPDLLRVAEAARAVRAEKPPLGLFFSTDDVILVPGFLGSELVDVKGADGLIWIDPKIVLAGTAKLLKLKLGKLPTGPGQVETDANLDVNIRPHGAVPVIYSGLQFDLEVRRYSVQVFGFDWRKDIEESAATLAALIRDRARQRFRPLHIIAHSQGAVVARRAIQLVGSELGRQLVTNLVLLGPATAGTFSAALAIAGNHSLLDMARKFGIIPPDGFEAVLQSWTGAYQLLPWRDEPIDDRSANDPALAWIKQNTREFQTAKFWQTGVDPDRLAKFGWGRMVDTSFLNDRTTIFLGDQPTVGGVKFEGGKLVEDERFRTQGDGTVPDALARLPGVSRVFKAKGAEHSMLPATLSIIAAVRDVLAGRQPQVETVKFGAVGLEIPFLAEPARPLPSPMVAPVGPAPSSRPPAQPPGPPDGPAMRPIGFTYEAREVPAPKNRRLRVYSFDPLFSGQLNSSEIDRITIELPWDFADGDHLRPGPVGEYIEVVDFDPTNGLFYPPVDLNHPHLLAQDGLPVSEGDPRFHQQMVYAVAMGTIRQFELALGRKALWAPHLKRDPTGEVIKWQRLEEQYLPRLRIYPHALRQANAYYSPDQHALLLGYFQATGDDVGRNLPGGTIFASLSYDIIAHETTHALMHGLHRYLIEPSNPDVLAFHEGFADIVAMFQHFSHPEVLRNQLQLSRGDLERESQLGVLAAQFGEAMGMHGSLRRYLGEERPDENGKIRWQPIKPDPNKIHQASEPHERGAILVAALFRAFKNIYENRVKDLRRIATGGTGILPHGDLHPDLVNRMADEASKAARHMLRMSIRALDYIPPVDINFGEYLRALITADYDLVGDDPRDYRKSVVSAFRDWGIYPSDVRSLSVDSLLWSPPELDAFQHPIDLFRSRGASGPTVARPADDQAATGNSSDAQDVGSVFDWDLKGDRRAIFMGMQSLKGRFHDWLMANISHGRDEFLGLFLEAADTGDPASDANPYKSIRRDEQGRPVFEIHHVRPCRRIGPDGQQQQDIIIEIVQRRRAYFDAETQRKVDFGEIPYDDPAAKPDFYFRGGCTLIVDPESGDIRYCVRKKITQDGRLDHERRFRQGQFADLSAGAYISDASRGNPFAFLHHGL